jgi:3-(3-hydroxy-phenyl)propionate hydroxylase
MERTQVLIAGAGPAGAVAAYALAQKGIDVILLEAASHCPADMRASTLHPPTLDILESLGLFESLEAQGLRAPIYQYRNRATGETLDFDLGELADISKHPYRLQCEQYKLARLASGLIGDRARFNERVIFVEQDDTGVTVHVERPLDVAAYRADYVIAADGANSIVRKILGVPFEGFTIPEKFMTLSTAYPVEKHFPGLANVSYVADAAEWCVLLRIPTLWRVMVPIKAEEPDADAIGDARKEAIFSGLLGLDSMDIKTEHRTLYRVHQRVAPRYDHGRVILAGDAAHLNNPLGGFGMNSGIHDVYNLTEKLGRIINGGEEAAPLLAHYDRQRRTVMNDFVQAQTITNRAEMTSAAERHKKYEAILADPDQRRAYLLKQSMYDSRTLEASIA